MTDRCQICGDVRPNSMETHHVIPRRYGGADTDENTVRLCSSCHAAVESVYNDATWERTPLAAASNNADGGTIQEFIQQRIKIDESYEPVPKSEVYEVYKEFCENGNTNPRTTHAFTKELTSEPGVDHGRHYLYGRDEQMRCYENIKII